MSIQELAKYYLLRGETLKAAYFARKAVEQEPNAVNLTLLGDIYMQQGLHDDAAALYLRAVKAGLK